MKKIIYIMLMLVLVFSLLCGCVQQTSSPKISVTQPIETSTLTPTETPVATPIPTETPIIEEEINLQEIAEEICVRTKSLKEETNKKVYKAALAVNGGNSKYMGKYIENLTPEDLIDGLEATYSDKKPSLKKFQEWLSFIQTTEYLQQNETDSSKLIVLFYYKNAPENIKNSIVELHEYTAKINSNDKDNQLEGAKKLAEKQKVEYLGIVATNTNYPNSYGCNNIYQEAAMSYIWARPILAAMDNGLANTIFCDTSDMEFDFTDNKPDGSIAAMDDFWFNAKIYEIDGYKFQYPIYVNYLAVGVPDVHNLYLSSSNNNSKLS